MALLDSEIVRIKAELGYPLLSLSTPYIGITSIFEQVIQVYMTGGAATTSSTAVTAATTATPVTITLASGTGFTTGDRVVIDVDDRQEIVTAQRVTGASLTVLLTKEHSGTYPVTVEGGESIVREILGRIRAVKNSIAALSSSSVVSIGGTSYSVGGLKKVDEVEFYGASSGSSSESASSNASQQSSLAEELAHWRNELAATLGVQNMWSYRNQGAQRVSVY
jgi:hypothetical protein